MESSSNNGLGSCRTLGLTAVLAAAAGSAHAAIINVPADQPTIAAAVAAANANPGFDEIVVDSAFSPFFVSNLDFGDVANGDLLIRSTGGSAVTTINGGGARIFQIDKGQTSASGFRGFTFTGGTASGAGAGFIGNASPTFIDCAFVGNTSTSSGGALIISLFNFGVTLSGPTNPVFENCSFTNNSGTGTTATRRGGAVYVLGASPTFRNTTFTGNSHARQGGAIDIRGTTVGPFGGVEFENCTFSGNICNGAGGNPAVSIDARDVTFTGCTFNSHTTTSTAGGTGIGMSGATPETLTLINTTFTGHTSTRPILSIGFIDALNITGGSFTGNGPAPLGSPISINPSTLGKPDLSITGTTFSNNTVTIGPDNFPLITTGGNGLDQITLTNVNFLGNTTSAVLFANSANSITISGGAVTNNAGGGGMVVAFGIGSISIDGTSFTGNSGLINVSGSGTSNFSLSNASISANSGGAIAITDFTTAAITGGTISGHLNAAGRISINGSGDHTIDGTLFSNNSLGSGSSAALISATGNVGSGSLAVNNATFTGINSTGSSARVIGATDLASLSVNASTFNANINSGSSADIINATGIVSASVIDSVFDANTCSAVSFTDSTASVSGSNFINNRSAINSTNGPIEISDSRFLGGTTNGGSSTAVSISDAATATITSVRIAKAEDGGISVGGVGSLTVLNSLITGTTGDSGAIALFGDVTAEVINCTLADNTPSGGGAGAISVHENSSVAVANTIAYGNAGVQIDDETNTTGTVSVSFSNVEGGYGGTGNIDFAPFYTDADGADNLPNTLDDDFSLAAGSPGIDEGDSASVPVTLLFDLAFNDRIFNSIVDIGAFEFQGCPSDFDGSGFVDSDDFDAFVLAFEAGDQSADFDGTGFVDGDDFDAFVRAFEAGC